MPDCPTCHQAIDSQAVTCPYCRTVLKAHGHPGMPLHRASGNTFLCQTCLYDQDDTCTFPKRPHARDCTLYNDGAIAPTSFTHSPARGNWGRQAIAWVQRHAVWLGLASLIGISLFLALRQRSGR